MTLASRLTSIFHTSKRRLRTGGVREQRAPTRRTVELPIGV